MRVTVIQVPQRSPAWHLARLGRLTGSRAGDMRARGRHGEAVSRAVLRQQLVAERLTGRVVSDGFATDAMRRGIALEPAAIAAYEAATGRLVQRTGFLAVDDAMLGCSLDGHVGAFEGIVEVKCRASWAHLDALQGGPVPARDLAQVTHNLLVSGAAWCDVVSYDDRFGPSLRIAITRVWRAAVAIVGYAAQAEAFLATVARDVAIARGEVAGIITHFVVWDEIVRFGWSRALCGTAVVEADIAVAPTCPACQHELARTAGDVFGPPAAALDRVPRPAPLRAPRRRRRGVA